MKPSRTAVFLARAAVLLLAVTGAWATWQNLLKFPRTEDAEVRANVAGVAPQVGGSIVRLHVVDNQPVKRGDLLFEIDARPYEAEAARARARLELVRLDVRALEDEIAAAAAALRDRAARAEYAASHYERLKPLLAGNFTSADRVQRAKSEAESAEAMVREAEAAAARARNKLGELDGRNSRIDEAKAALRDAELRASYCKVYAPCNGHVTNLQIAPGTYAGAGAQVFSIVDSSAWFILANFRETDLSRIRAGQRVKVYLMSRRGAPLAGTVQGIARAVYPLATASRAAPAGEGVFSRVEPTFDFVQLAQRFPVRILLEGGEIDSLRMGGKAAVIVDTRSTPGLESLRRMQPGEEFTPPFQHD
ncbi:MAG: HlyD family secretion protein [Verrucomicrobiae bacterium]